MGKKNKIKNNPLWAMQNPGKAKEMEERFGVDIRMTPGWKSDSGESYEEYQKSANWHGAMQNAARNDYDLRRTLESAAMSGKKKAQKILDNGFNSINDVQKAMNFSEKAAKRHGQGGDFSSNSDYMGLTQSMVERDRRKQTEGYEKTFATKDDLDEIKAKTVEEQVEDAKYQPSEKMKQAKERVAGYKDGVSTKGDGDEQRTNAASSYEKYKLDLPTTR